MVDAPPGLLAPAPGSSAWVRVPSSGPVPSPRYEAGIAYDPRGNFTLLFGGTSPSRSAANNDTWEFSNQTWKNLSSIVGPAPSERQLPLLAFDAADGYLLLFGGFDQTGPNRSASLGDTWKFANQGWTNITTSAGPGPPPRYFANMAYDPVVRGVILFGGLSAGGGRLLNDTWEFGAGQWQNISVSSGPRAPPARDEQSMAFDQGDGYLVLYGGFNQSSTRVYNDTWRFSGGVWSQLFPTSNPGPLRASFFGQGAQTGRYPVLFGGDPAATLGGSNATWEVRGAEWFNLSSEVGPPPSSRAFGGMTWDGGDNLAILFGGVLFNGANATAYNDTWALATTPSVYLAANPSAADVGQVFFVNAFLTGGTLPVSYNWTGLPLECPAANADSIRCRPSSAASYSISVLVTDALGLVATSSVSVVVSSAPLVTIAAVPVAGPAPLSVSFTANTFGGAPPLHVEWQFGDGFGGSNSPTSHRYASSGRFNASVWANDSNGGSATAILEVEVGLPLSVFLQATPSFAVVDIGQNLTLTASASGGIPPYVFAWSGLPAGCPPANSPTIYCPPSQSGTSAAKVTVTDSQGRGAFATLVVTTHARLGITAKADSLAACGPSAVNYTATVTGGSWPYVVHWNFGPGDTPNGSAQQRSYPDTGTQVSLVTVTDSVSSVANTSATVDLIPCGRGTARLAGLTAVDWLLVGGGIVTIAFAALAVRYRHRPPRPQSTAVEDLTDADDWIR